MATGAARRASHALLLGLAVLASTACKQEPTAAPVPPLTCGEPSFHGRTLAVDTVEHDANAGKLTVTMAWTGHHPLDLDARVIDVEGSANQMVQGHAKRVRVDLQLDPAAGGTGGFRVVATTHHQGTRCAVERAFRFDASGAEPKVDATGP